MRRGLGDTTLFIAAETGRPLDVKALPDEIGVSVIHCNACSEKHAVQQLVIGQIFRFEGPTDPGDEAIVLGVSCPTCGAKGIVVSAYGPDADPELLALVRNLND